MVLNGLINTRILAICRELDVQAVGLSGVDAGLVQAHKRKPVKLEGSNELVDYGLVGDIDRIDTTAIRNLLDDGYLPVISPLSADEHGTLVGAADIELAQQHPNMRLRQGRLRAGRWEDRWFKTGDTVAHDDAGYLRILGRTSVDILKSGGYKLSALEIEEALREHEAVAEVAVVGVPDVVWGDRVVACVVARPGRESECAEGVVRAFAKERLAPYKVPKQVIVMAELPRNAVGKVVKPELVKRIG